LLSRFTFVASLITDHFPLLTLTLLASWPLLSGGLPTVGDGFNHFHRFAQLDWHIRHADFYPRWFVNLHYGFGAPVFNFYAPLSYYIPLVFRLFNLPLATCLLLGYILAFGVAIFGVYHWVGDQFDSPLAGLAASAAYALSPYLYLNALHRGAYPELWGLALAPWLLWSAHRVVVSPNIRSLLVFAVIQSILIVTHTLSALIFAPIAIIYILALSFSVDGWRSALRLFGIWFLGFGISLALSAFFTLPVLLESKDIQLYRTFLPGDLDYRNNFLTLSTLLSLPANFDPHLVFNLMPASLPWPQLTLACVALLDSIRKRERRRIVLGFWILGFGICFLTLSASAPLWSALPLARLIQFPWRLVGPASLFLAALAGVGLTRLASRHFGILGFWLLGFAIFSFFLFSLSWTYHINFDSLPATVSPADAVNYEITTGQLGTTAAGEYLPRWVGQLPAPDTLNFSETELPSRLAPLPATVTVDVLRLTLHAEELSYNSPQPFTATFNRFYFPGWAATVDHAPASISPSSPNGLIAVAAPAGQHTLRLELRPTRPQAIGTVISLIALVSLIALGFQRSAVSSQPPAPRESSFVIRHPLGAFVIILLLTRILYFDRVETPFHHTNLNNLPNPVSVNFDDQLELIGFEYAPTLTSNNQLPITLYWRALAPLTIDYSVTVQLADRFGNRFGLSDSQHPGRVPTSRWALDQYARDTHPLVSLPGTPPGHYRLLTTVYSAHPLSILQDTAPIGVEYEIGVVTVTRAEAQPPGLLRLAGHELASDTVTAGDQLAFTLVWNSGEKPLSALTARLGLTDSAGVTLFSADLPPAGEDYPTTQWTPNELVRFPFNVGLPPSLPGGPARVSLTLVGGAGAVAAGPFDLGTITLVVPERSFVIPPMAHRVDHDFGGAIRLLGYDLTPDSITLYWQSLKPVDERLTVFVHALDASGAFVAGHDAAPTRPTTGWLPGEVIVDAHPIVVGNDFEVGLYDPISGERFGETFVTRP